MVLTTSYFAVAHHLDGTRISIARMHHPRIRSCIDEFLPAFAPSLTLIKTYKEGNMSWNRYVEIYTQEQRGHYKSNPENFLSLLERAVDENLILMCYEKYEGPETKCHRLLMFDMLKKVATLNGIDDLVFVQEQIYKRK